MFKKVKLVADKDWGAKAIDVFRDATLALGHGKKWQIVTVVGKKWVLEERVGLDEMR
jgi:hypothetical protein